jgi:hypothetical protein
MAWNWLCISVKTWAFDETKQTRLNKVGLNKMITPHRSRYHSLFRKKQLRLDY